MINKKPAFTLVEVLISVLIMTIIIGAVSMTAKLAIGLFEKAQANALVTNGLRFTVDSFNREISPLLDHTDTIAVLEDNTKLPSALPSSSDHYLYMESGSVIHWSRHGKEPLAGSECIVSLDFLLPSETEKTAANYMLSIDIGARHPKYDTAKADAAISQALYTYSKLVKSGDKKVDSNYSGKVLHFTVTDIVVTAFNLHIKNSKDVTLDKSDVNAGETLYASYDLKAAPAPSYSYQDKSTVTWYISLTKDASLNPDTQENALTEENMSKYYWQIVTSDDKIVTGKEFKTGDTFYVKDKDGTKKEWGKYGYVRFVLEPAIDGAAGNLIKSDLKGQSEWVRLKNAEDRFTFWEKGLIENGNRVLDGTDIKSITTGIDPTTGKELLKIKGTSTGTTGTATIINAKITPEYLAEQKRISIETNDYGNQRSYTTMANYSIIFDYDIETSDGFTLLLGGYRDSTIKDTGLVLQFMAKSDTMPLRIHLNGSQSEDSQRDSWGIGDNGKASNKLIAYTSETANHKFTGHGTTSKGDRYYGPFYGPGYMKNSLFQYLSDYYTTDNNNSTWLSGSKIVPRAPYNKRCRVLVTVLEYYYSAAQNTPHYIVRVKYLKLANDGSLPTNSKTDGDPMNIGPGWFNSEPVWYGDFVGEQPEVISSSGNGTYRFKVKNYTLSNSVKSFDVAGNALTLATAAKPENGQFYTTRVTKDEIVKTGSSFINSIFEAMAINIRDEIQNTQYKSAAASKKSTADNKLKNPVRERYIGFSTWSNEKKEFSSTVYELELAPGFTMEELKAIVPKYGKMYNIDEIGDSAPDGVSQALLNTIFYFSISNGTGNNGRFTDGAVGIQHVMGTCTCPMCKRFLK